MGIVSMATSHAPAVAKLHRLSIQTGLTAWLGQTFCERYYKALAGTPHSFVLVYVDEAGCVLGFVCGATDTAKAYRHILRRRLLPLAFAAIGKLMRPSVWKKIWTAVRRPTQFRESESPATELPAAEVVSLGVDPAAQGKRIGSQLVAAVLDRFRKEGVSRCLLWTSDDNTAAQAFHQRQGFTRVGIREHHSGPIHVFVADFAESSVSGNDRDA